MWVHVPSFLVGSAVSGSGFLLIHQQLSHRSRLSPKWPLREYAEDELRSFWKQYGPSSSSSNSNQAIISTGFPLADGWNKAVRKVQEALKKEQE